MKQAIHLGLLPSLVALIALLAIAYPSDAQTFNPNLQVVIDDTTPETASGFTIEFGIPKEDTMFAGLVQFIPRDWGIVRGDAIEVGTEVGELEAQATLGLIGGACQSALPVLFEFENASLDRGDTVSFDDDDDNGTEDFAEDKDENGILDGVEKYPDFLNDVFEDLQPIRRTAGMTIVAGIPVFLQFLIFEPGTEISDEIPFGEDLGYPTVTVLQDIGDDEAEPEPGAITDFCAPLSTVNVTLGTSPDGQPLYVTPQNGTYTFTTIALGQRDADGDGFENSLDTCPFTINVGDPKVTNSGDLDSDGLDAACDPNDDLASGGTDSDEDADGYLNRQDNCPLEPNGQAEDNQADEDLDQIGDACDPDPTVEDGELSTVKLEEVITIGDGTGPGGPPSADDWPGIHVLGEDGSNGSGDDGGSSSGVIIAIIIAVVVAVAVIGGGAAMMMRRREA